MTALLLAGALALVPPTSEAPVAPADSATGVLRGTVRQADGATPVAGALVEVRAGEFNVRVRTGRDGRYRVEDVPAGWVTVSAGRQGFRGTDLRVRVPEGRTVAVHFDLRLDPVVLPTIRVEGLPAPEHVTGDTELGGRLAVARANPGSPRIEALKSGALGGSGMARTVRRVVRPDPADPSLLYFRGGTAPFKQVLLDGAPVQTPFHMGGLLSSYPEGVLSRSDLRSGGAPVRLGGGLFYTLDLETRSPEDDAFRTAGSVDMVGARTRAEGSVGDGSYLLSARSLYGEQPIGGPAVTRGRDYSDVVGRLSWGEPGSTGISATGFRNREAVPLDETANPRLAEWGNAAGSVRFTVGEGRARLEGTAATGEFESEIPLAIRGFSGASARLREDRAVLRWVDGWSDLAVEAGAELRRKARRVAFRGLDGTPRATLEQSARRAGGFLEATWRAAPGVSLRAGLRGDYYTPYDGTKFSPRGSARFQMGEHTSVQVSGGRVNQLIAAPLADTVSGPPSPAAEQTEEPTPIPAAAPLRPGTADHLTVRFEHEHDRALSFGLEGQFKAIHGLAEGFFAQSVDPARGSLEAATPETALRAAGIVPAVGPADSNGGSSSSVEPDLYSSGMDLWLDWGNEHVAAWGTYSLTWLWSRDSREAVSDRFAARQVLTAGTEVRLPGDLRATLEAAGSWGLPFTPVPAPEPQVATSLVPSGRGGVRGPLMNHRQGGPPADERSPFFRLDARIERSWSTTFFGLDARLTPYAAVLNVLDRDDALFYRLPTAGSGLEPVTAVPLLPMVGIRWETGGP